MKKFQMDEYLIRIQDCTTSLLIEKFEKLKSNKSEFRIKLSKNNIEVKKNILESGMKLKEILT